ncbi:MAG: PIN domain-containing protein [Acidobacteria bacterium]|nr:PIN domain-containing protein [Acidobacteriota bacterium]MBI3263644.1 PIN domain-containing protein [Acidobacteriota bacterium]
MSRAALLDVNVLVALFDPEHVHHETAHDWFSDNQAEGWATCPLTENGFVRVLSNPARGGEVFRPAELVARMRRFCRINTHQFWPDALSLRDGAVFDPSFVGSHRHVTDVYLLGLAMSRGGRLATFDRGIPLKAVVGAKPSHLAVIAPVDSA